jgi:hypothetical protein
MIKIPTLLLFAFASLIAKAQNNPVVVELFTSQGCSSCPDADKNLTEILQRAKKEGKQVYGLSFHVDYWNYIGWKDPYSSKEFTVRQRKYGEQMNLRSIYTPQMIVNGKKELVGSNRIESAKAIADENNQKPTYQISLHDIQIKDEILSFSYQLDKNPTDEIINFAIVEKDIENYVPRGENSGRKLHHDNVVRSFVTQSIVREQAIKMTLPKINLNNVLLIVYVQDNLVVTGATSSALK